VSSPYPFNTGIAQGIAELPIFSGIGLRLLLMVGAILIGAQHTIAYGKKYKLAHHPNLTLEYAHASDEVPDRTYAELSRAHISVLVIVLIAIITLLFGVLKLGWYFEEMISLFMAMGLISGLIYFKGNFNKVGNAFIEGTKEMTVAVIYFGLARSIMVVMEKATVMDTIVYALSIPLSNLNNVLAAWGIYLSQGITNFFIPSSSGQAAAVMPILTPLSDLIGVTRQTTVLAYQCGDGFWNMITPTHSIVCAVIGMAGVSFTDWFKFAWRLVIKWSIWTLIILTIASVTNYGPF